MKVLIFGAGVIGSIYGQALSESGTEIIHYVRPNKSEKLQNGLVLQMLDGRKRTRSISKQYKPNR
ncbi:2-dehydropantoate 2-reductase N-terminal domain-containing protein [Paenibacillus sp. BR2-3]|uniref:ketopantoate reductase family protein n=1 Tax=Paenibacillus sp. BR2-3 TaxID=3048494 RepID=UPI003977506C